jgi:hypothetical protein
MVPNTEHILQFCCLNYGPGHIQCNYRSTYSGFNIQQIVAQVVLEICRPFNVRYIAIWVLNTPHTRQFTQCVLRSRKYAMYLQFLIFRQQYSSEGICAAIGYIPKFRCALYCKHCAKYVAHPPDYAMWTMIPYIYNVITVPHIQASIFNKTKLRCYWRYRHNSMSVILQTWSKI